MGSTGTQPADGEVSIIDHGSECPDPTTAANKVRTQVQAEERARAAEQVDAALARQREREAREDKDDKVIKPALATPVGLYGFLGGGATNFTEPTAVGATDVGGYWDARVGIGTRSVVGAEVAYVGSARNIQALGLSNDSYLIGNGVEGIGRLNVPITVQQYLFEPYTFVGLGWQHYNLMTDGVNTSSIDNNDDIMTVPLGIGTAFGFYGVTLDARLTYRQAFYSTMFGSQTSSFADTSMNSWGAGAALGFEF